MQTSTSPQSSAEIGLPSQELIYPIQPGHHYRTRLSFIITRKELEEVEKQLLHNYKLILKNKEEFGHYLDGYKELLNTVAKLKSIYASIELITRAIGGEAGSSIKATEQSIVGSMNYLQDEVNEPLCKEYPSLLASIKKAVHLGEKSLDRIHKEAKSIVSCKGKINEMNENTTVEELESIRAQLYKLPNCKERAELLAEVSSWIQPLRMSSSSSALNINR